MKEKRIIDVLGKVDEIFIEEAAPDKYIHEDFNYIKKTKLSAWVKWGAVAAGFTLILALGISRLIASRPFPLSAPKGMYNIGTVWETDEFSFCVVNAAFCNEYRTETGDIITPGDGCRFIAVEYNASYARGVTLSECTLKKGDVYSRPHTAYMEPIPLTGGDAGDGDGYILLFSIPLSESDADTPSQDSYSLSVEVDTGERTYARDFSLAQ